MVKNHLNAELIFDLLLLGYGLIYFFQTITMNTSTGARFFPVIFSSIFIISIIVTVKNTILKQLKSEGKQTSSTKSLNLKKFLSVFLGCVFVVVVTYFFSYWLAILIVLPLMMFILDDYKWSPALLILPAGMVLATYLIFIRLLSVRVLM